MNVLIIIKTTSNLTIDVLLLNFNLKGNLFWRIVVEEQPSLTRSSEAEAEREIKELASIGDDRVKLNLETRFNMVMVSNS